MPSQELSIFDLLCEASMMQETHVSIRLDRLLLGLSQLQDDSTPESQTEDTLSNRGSEVGDTADHRRSSSLDSLDRDLIGLNSRQDDPTLDGRTADRLINQWPEASNTRWSTSSLDTEDRDLLDLPPRQYRPALHDQSQNLPNDRASEAGEGADHRHRSDIHVCPNCVKIKVCQYTIDDEDENAPAEDASSEHKRDSAPPSDQQQLAAVGFKTLMRELVDRACQRLYQVQAAIFRR